MNHDSESIPGDAAAPAWVLNSTIDAARLEQLHDALTDAISAFLMSGQANKTPAKLLAVLDAYRTRTQRLRGRALAVFPWLCVAGLILALAFSAGGGITWRGYRIDLLFVLYFGAGLALVRPLGRLGARPPRPLGWRPPQWTWLWKLLARRISARMLRVARRAAPFDARYAFAGRTVTYTRVTEAGTTVVWQRTLQGWRVSGSGFTLVLKSRRSLQGILILHEPNVRLDTWLAGLGIEPIGARNG
jgi:hypothetical protein